MRQSDWVARERGLKLGLLQARRLLELGLRRPFTSLVASVGLALVALSGVVLLRPAYQPRYVIRVIENDRDPGMTTRPNRQLREYVLGSIFTSDPLFRIMQKDGVSPALLRKNPRAALESFREDIEVEVYRNYFVAARDEKSPPRSARVAVRYESKDPDLALAVTRDLGQLIVEHEQEVRRVRALRAAREADRFVNVLASTLEERRRRVLAAKTAMGSGTGLDSERVVELVSLAGSLEPLELRLAEAERQKASLDLGSAFADHGAGMFFEIVDSGSIPPSARAHVKRYLAVFLGSLCFGFPLVAIAVGAFAPKRGLA